MRNRNLTIAAMVGLLVAGLGLGAYFLLSDGRPASRGQTATPSNLNETAAHNEPAANADKLVPAHNEPAGNKTSETPPPDVTVPDVAAPDVIARRPDPTTAWTARARQIVVTGRVVTRSDQRPALGAAVTAELSAMDLWADPSWEPSDGRPGMTVSGDTTTDASGKFTLRLTATAHYTPEELRTLDDSTNYRERILVTARLAGYAPGRTPTIFLGSETEYKDIEIQLTIPAAARGKVVDAVTSAGLANAHVEFRAMDSSGTMAAARITRTDAEGLFAFSDLSAAAYVINIRRDGYMHYSGWSEPGGQPDLSKGGDTDLGEFALARAAVIKGRVVKADGTALDKVAVQLEVPGGLSPGWFGGRGTSGPDGNFEVANVSAGTYRVRFKADYGRHVVDGVVAKSGEATVMGTVVIEKGLTLTVVVVSPDGRPKAGAALRLLGELSGGGFGLRSPGIGEAKTDADGRAVFPGLLAGGMLLITTAEGFASPEQSLTLSADTTLKVVLQQGGAIVGRVVGPDGEAAPKAWAKAVRIGSLAHTRVASFGHSMEKPVPVAADGLLRLAHLEPGTWAVWVGAPGSPEETWPEVQVQNGQDTDIGTIQLKAPGTLRVRVTLEGNPLPELRVGLMPGAWGREVAGTTTDAAGYADFTGLTAGDYTVTTARDEAGMGVEGRKLRRLTIKSGQHTEFAVELQPRDGITLSGRVLLDGQARFRNIRTQGQGDLSAFSKSGKVAEGGFFEIVGLKPGRYSLLLSLGDGAPAFVDELVLGTEPEVEFERDYKSLRVSGRVVMPEGSEDKARTVTVKLTNTAAVSDTMQDRPAGSVDCDAAGEFRFLTVQTGQYRLQALVQGGGIATADITVADTDIVGVVLQFNFDTGGVRLKVSKLHGATGGLAFAQTELADAAGRPVPIPTEYGGMFGVSVDATTEISYLKPGTYTLTVRGRNCVALTLPDVKVTKGTVTELLIEMTVAATLSLSFTNEGITQAQLDAATVRYFDAQGGEVKRDSSPWDNWDNTATPEQPTLVTGYLSSKVKEVRVKLAGYKEVVVPVVFEPAKKIVLSQTLQPE